MPEWHRDEAVADLARRLDMVVRTPIGELAKRHQQDYQALFQRVHLNFGGSAGVSLPTDERLRRDGANDPDLVALLFQYGRYLLIVSSRPGNLPANL